MCVGVCVCMFGCTYMLGVCICVTDEVVRKRNDTLQWSREGEKHSVIDNRIIIYSVIMLLCVCK